MKRSRVVATILTGMERSIPNCSFTILEIPMGGGAIRSPARKREAPVMKFFSTSNR